MKGLFTNIPGGSAVAADFSGTDLSTTGTVQSFNQGPIITEALAEYTKQAGASATVNHKLGETGSVFIPTGCKDEASAKKCKVMISFHGCGDRGASETAYWRRAAENNNVIIIGPSIVGGCWDGGECYTDARFCQTKFGIQQIFIRKLIEKAGQSKDASRSMLLSSMTGYVAPSTTPTFVPFVRGPMPSIGKPGATEDKSAGDKSADDKTAGKKDTTGWKQDA